MGSFETKEALERDVVAEGWVLEMVRGERDSSLRVCRDAVEHGKDTGEDLINH